MNTLSRSRCSICFFALLLGLVLTVLPTVACAEETDADAVGVDAVGVEEDTDGAPTTSTMGYITLLLTGEANGSGSTMTGGAISLYRVAAVDRSDPTNHVYDISRGQFASSKDIASINSLTKEQLDALNPTISESLESDVYAQNIEPLQTANIENGQVTFPKTEEGLYLLVQTVPSDGNRNIRSFMMSVPNEEGELGVVAKPKPGSWDGIDLNKKEDSNSSEQTSSETKKEDSDSSKQTSSETKKTTPATTSTPTVENRVPATGDRAPAFALVAVAGAWLVVMGARWSRRGNRAS